MSASTIEQTEMIGTPSDLFSGTPSLPVEPDQGILKATEQELVQTLRVQLDTTVFRLLTSAQSSEEFRDLRKELFPRYTSLSGAISNLIRIDLTGPELGDVLTEQYTFIISWIEKDTTILREDDQREEVVFCVEALHRAHKLLFQISEIKAPEASAGEDARLIQETIRYMWWSIMHLRCLVYAICHSITPSIEVQHEVVKGLRPAVNAYAAVRGAWAIRFECDANPLDLSQLEADDEDRYLLASADEEFKHIWKPNEK